MEIYIIGKKAGTNALRYKLKSLGIKTEDHLPAKSLTIIKIRVFPVKKESHR